MSITTTLFPSANREAALVAFLRTFWQVVRATALLGGAGIITVSATQVAHVDVALLGYTIAGILISGVISGLLAAGDILAHGLPDAYSSAAIASAPAAVVSSVTIPAPADPAQPAAGTPPSL